MESIHVNMKHWLFGVCLISAWDIAKGNIAGDAMLETDVVILDSGGYEANGYMSVGSRHNSWSESQHRSVLSTMDKSANVIAVSFDRQTSLEEQIRGALTDVEWAPDAASDFLVKPTLPGGLVNIPGVGKFSSSLGTFDVIGVTAREIARSFIGRCRAIVMLRDILDSAGLDLPIHVFGAITPYEVLAYFLCGADVFDGLNWLRLAYRRDKLITMEEAAFEAAGWNQNDSDLYLTEWTNNLAYLYRMQESMRAFAGTGDLARLSSELPIATKIARIAEIAGAELHQGETNHGW